MRAVPLRAGSSTPIETFHVRVLPPPAGCTAVEPPIVFLPALGFTGESFSAVAERITVCRARVLVDLPGTGQSAALEGVQARAVLRTLSRFVADEGPVILVGHSLGGVIAVRLAAEAPANVRALVLLDAPLAPFPLAWWQRAALHPWVWTPMLHIIGAIRATRFVLRRLDEHPNDGSGQSIRLLGHELATRSSRRTLLAYYRSFLLPGALHEAELDLAKIHVPVLVLWGSHDHVVPESMVAEILGDLPRGTPVITRSLPTGHLAPLEKPSEVARAISQFARQLAPLSQR